MFLYKYLDTLSYVSNHGTWQVHLVAYKHVDRLLNVRNKTKRSGVQQSQMSTYMM